MSRWVSSLLLLSLSCGILHALPLKADEGNAWERSGKFEGDIVFRDGQDPRNGLINTDKRWPQATLIYKLDVDLTTEKRNRLMGAFNEITTRTCVRLREKSSSTEYDFVYITDSQAGCWSYVGRIGGQQDLSLGLGCWQHGTIVHELLHAFGFHHMQSATDRDDYVTIMWKNIELGQEHNFNKYPDTMITDFGVQYDYGSLMHYRETAFSSNGQPTIVPKDPNAVIGQNNGLSVSDIEKLELMYGCRK